MDCISQPPATQSSQLDSTLLGKLPRELRDQIYREAVVEDNDIPIHVSRYKTEDGERRRRMKIGHSLLRVCKQTREEVAEMYYLENTFRITDDLFEKRAVGELNRLLAPWARRMAKLRISHKCVRSEDEYAEINFSISASQGRTVVEPESASVKCVFGLDHDASLGTTSRVARNFKRMCFCNIFKFTLEHDGRGVISWMQGYVDLVLQSQVATNDKPYCWTCAGRVFI